MLTFDQIKALEKALGPEAAVPVIEAIQTTDQRVMSALLAEVATKADLARLETDLVRLEGKIDARLARLETMVRILIGLAVVAIGMFSPVAAGLVGVLNRLTVS